MPDLKTEVISVGTELLLGQIVNSNTAWISDRVANLGISMYYHQTVGDNLQRVEQAFKTASLRSDIVFITGGLGPTEDDLTREAFSTLSGIPIEEDEKTFASMETFFKNRNKGMTPNNRKQAHVFKDSMVIENPVGIAPGIIVEYANVTWIFTPGVPKEMEAILDPFVFTYLRKKYKLDSVIRSKMLRFIGIGESQLEHDLLDIIKSQSNPTIAPLASEGEVALRLTAKASDINKADQMIEEVEQKIKPIVGQFIYGENNRNIEETVIHLLAEKQLSLSSAESLTGGLFSDKLVSVSGASQVFQGSAVVYSSKAKNSVLEVPFELIEKYGTISEECAELLAKNATEKFNSDIGISFTGVAGPNKSEGKDIGTVYISLYTNGKKAQTTKHHFHGDRSSIRTRAVKKGLEILFHHLKNL
ncbi:competence/damage-inducible protein A [Saliterribacillus persicus]|uniref:Putative competence-damage inducible protein n=1 Tax=Saliterribacillus persicus TaxID=930114 RepID=A0A368XRH4_9BACI|nr:competence/damage-inducible protein A [Saliterribacillus persicus]RCW70650.1 competence/damage-inducible protein cinA [Saliterribacillus persicus]